MLEYDAQEAADLAGAFDAMITARGGVDLSREAEADPAARTTLASALDGFGVWDIDPFAGSDEALFASVLCHRAGTFNLPFPVAERLAAARLDGVDAVAVVDAAAPVVAHAGLDLRWAGLADGVLRGLTELPAPDAPARIAPFAASARLGDPVVDRHDADRETLALLLTSTLLLGTCDTAAGDTYAYVGTRRQFGSPIGSFQGLRFALTDVATALQGAHELGRYALWSFTERRADALADALTYRIAVLEAADITFTRCHQAYGAIGLCDETDLSWLSRHSRALRHAPWGITRTEQRLLEVSTTHAVVGPFSA
jgi:hypothetical protein